MDFQAPTVSGVTFEYEYDKSQKRNRLYALVDVYDNHHAMAAQLGYVAQSTDADGNAYEGIGLAAFTTVQSQQRTVCDVYGHTDLYPEAVVGFLNKSSVTDGVETPLLTTVAMGHGNKGEKSSEGYHWKNVFASQLTGPILVKNPPLLRAVVSAIYARWGEALPEQLPMDRYAEDGYAITAEQLKKRSEK